MRLVLGFLSIWWPAMLGVALASLAAGSPDRRVLRGTDGFWVAAAGIGTCLSFVVGMGGNVLYRDAAAAAVFAALAAWVSVLATRQSPPGPDSGWGVRLLGFLPGWLLLPLAPLGVLVVHCTSGRCL
jgi:hypothetical protein